jgi:uncharacterized protein (DUF305 family)
MKQYFCGLAAALVFACAALNPAAAGAMKHGSMAQAAKPAEAGSTIAYKAAMDGMMQGMMQAPTGVADVDFASGMVSHHQGAIAMAEVVLKFGKDANMKKLARNIIAAQKGEIEQMKKWLAAHDPKAMPSSAEAAKATGAPMETMMQSMAINYSGKADIDFARGMIPHHQGAIDMAKVELQFGVDPEIKKLAQAIMDAQGPEIRVMQVWLAQQKG